MKARSVMNGLFVLLICLYLEMSLVFLLKNKFALLAIVCQYTCIVTFAQVTIGRVITNRKLEWTDFEGKADSISTFSAMTHWLVNYRTKVDSFHADTAFLSFQTTPVFQNYSSWVKKDKTSEDLLCHEQRHYDIAVICAKTLKETQTATVFLKRNYSLQVDSIANIILQSFIKMEDQYDIETNHMLNKKEQSKWNNNIQMLLDELSTCNYSK